MDSRSNTKITDTALEADLQRLEILLPSNPNVVAKVRGVMRPAAVPGIISHPSGEDVWEGTPVKDESATEGGKPSKPDDPHSVRVHVENEEKAEAMGPKEPPDSNAWCYLNHEDEPEGSVAPPDRKGIAAAGVISASVRASIIADPIGGPVLQLGSAGFEPGSAPELPLAHPKVPSPSESPVITPFNELSTPESSTHHVSLPHPHTRISVSLVRRAVPRP